MTKFANDELFLKGRIQVETVLDALGFTGINPAAALRLQTILDAHEQLRTDESQADLTIYLRGGATESEKADIITSLDALDAGQDNNQALRLAARALRELL